MALLTMISYTGGSAGLNKQKDKDMGNHLFPLWSNELLDIGITPKQIIPAQKTNELPDQKKDPVVGVLQPCTNNEQNSRIGFLLSLAHKKEFKICWKTEFKSGIGAEYILWAKDRIFIEKADGTTTLFSKAGTVIKELVLARDLLLDPAGKLFYYLSYPYDKGLLEVGRFSDGASINQIRLTYVPYFGSLNLKHGPILISTCMFQDENENEDELADHRDEMRGPNSTLIQAIDIRKSSYDSFLGLEMIGEDVGSIWYPSLNLIEAMHGDTLTIAVKNYVFRLDSRLKFQQAFTDTFRPLSMSLDEAGRIYLLVQKDGQDKFWLITNEGERAYEYNMPESFEYRTPVIGYDHTAFLISKKQIIAITQNGKMSWSAQAASCFSQAFATLDGFLLLKDGNEVIAFDKAGKRNVLFTFENDVPTTAPVLTDKGEILIASEKFLYCLKPTLSK